MHSDFSLKNAECVNQQQLSTCSLHTDSGWDVGKRGAYMVMKGSTRYWNYFEVYCPCAGGLSAVNAIGTQMRDPINSGLIRWRMAVLNKQK